MHNWFVARTKPSAEFFANANLTDQGFTTFLPLYRTRSAVRDLHRSAQASAMRAHKVHTLRNQHATSEEDRLIPLFPRYLFVHFDLSLAGWSAINSTRGITRLVEFNGQPSPVKPEAMDKLFANANAAGEIHIANPDSPIPTFAPGQRVEIVDGTLRGHGIEAVFLGYTKSGLARVELSILGGVRTPIPANALRSLT